MKEIKNIFEDLPIIETERLILRKIKENDVNDLFEYASKEEVTKYLPWDTNKKINDAKEFIGFVMDLYEKGEVAPWAIEYKENKKMIGTVGFMWWDKENKVAETGSAINNEYWGLGLRKEAGEVLFEFGFKEMKLERIQAKCFVENKSSERAMEKLGMIYEGTLRNYTYVKGKSRSQKMFSILKEEYFEKK